MNRIKEKIIRFTHRIKKEITIYRCVLKDERTPITAKVLLWLAISYLLLPIDLIPDFIPVFGQIDDLIIVPVLFYLAISIIPKNIIIEYRTKTE